MGTNKSYSEQFKLIKQDVRKTYDAITKDLTSIYNIKFQYI